MARPAADPRTVLAGTWRIHRVIRDHAAGRDGTFTGEADIAPDGAGLIWRESGTVRFGDHEGPAGRVLLVVPSEEGGWEVRFADGRPFHPLDLRTGDCSVVHLCGQDRYEGRYRLLDPRTMTVTWRVRGPRKDLELRGTYAACSSTEKSG